MKPQPRRAITKDTAKAVIVYFPHNVVEALDSLARANDTDRSKLIRKAVKQLLSRPA